MRKNVDPKVTFGPRIFTVVALLGGALGWEIIGAKWWALSDRKGKVVGTALLERAKATFLTLPLFQGVFGNDCFLASKPP